MLKHSFIAMLGLHLVACKPMPQETGTDVKTVDNFAAGSKVKNQICGPTSPSDLSSLNGLVSGPDESMRLAAIQSLAAIPAPLRGALFGQKLQGKVNLVQRSEVARQCRLTEKQIKVLNENGTNLDFCWSKQGNEPLRFWVTADVSIIRHGLLRLAAYAYLDLVEGIISDGSSRDHQAILDAMKSARSELSSVFLREMSSNPKFSANAPKFQAAHRQNPVEFDNQLFVEMVDSVYCSADSQHDFQGQFSKSFDQFVGRSGKIPLNFTKILGLPWHAR